MKKDESLISYASGGERKKKKEGWMSEKLILEANDDVLDVIAQPQPGVTETESHSFPCAKELSKTTETALAACINDQEFKKGRRRI